LTDFHHGVGLLSLN